MFMKTQTLSPKGLKSTVKFMGEQDKNFEKVQELETLLAKLKDKLHRQVSEIQARIVEVEAELAAIK